MKERPILFSAPMVRAILAGKKTQTRRLLKVQPIDVIVAERATRKLAGKKCWAAKLQDDPPRGTMFACSYGEVGDRLWVKETWARRLDEDHLKPSDLKPGYAWYWADPQTCNTGCAGAAGKKRVSIHMPRWASRITLEVAGVRVQRLHDISEKDADAEGVESLDGMMNDARLCARAKAMGVTSDSSRAWFAELWDSINADKSPWEGDPWVWAITFNVIADVSNQQSAKVAQ